MTALRGSGLTPDAAALAALFPGEGEMARRMRALDWSATPLGAPADWPQGLKSALRIMLDSRFAMWAAWGRELTFFCNDAYLPTVGSKQGWVLGASARKVWAEIWPDIGPRIEHVMRSDRATWDERLQLFLERNGYPEETYHTFSYSPLHDDAGRVAGMLCVVSEESERVIGERRLRVLRDLAAQTTGAQGIDDACRRIERALEPHALDVPFSCLYRVDAAARVARLASCSGAPPEAARPDVVALDGSADSGMRPWPLAAAFASGETQLVEGIAARVGRLPFGPWPEPVERALVLPLRGGGQAGVVTLLVVGVSTRRPLDAAYRDFFDLVAAQVASALADAEVFEAERRRAEALAEIDRAKTVFFTNVSHEFRTPLTLMLGPLEDLTDADEEDEPRSAAEQRRMLLTVQRNAERLLKLVNTLLDFARVEGGRAEARFEPTDLAALTADLASNFRAACERAGLALEVDCAELSEAAFVDRDLWEKIVLNLLSNAFKFTLQGGIAVRLRERDRHAELSVRDSGIGIAEADLGKLFNRFQRIAHRGGRSFEGSGIGLALVAELVRLHGGEIRAESAPGQGSTFVVTLPLGSAHLPIERVQAAPSGRPAVARAAQALPYVKEALQWLPEAASGFGVLDDGGDGAAPEAAAPRILVADDNRDLRSYLERLLGAHYRVSAVADGRAALGAARSELPDLVISDAMMPGLDGFGLLRALRADAATRALPVIMLSARAGEESRIEGLAAGADDYLVKPFSGRELLARVAAHLAAAHARREADAALRESERRLREEREQLRAMLEQGLAGIARLDAEGRFVMANARFAALLGRRESELIGEHVLDFTHPADRARNEALLAELLSGARTSFEIEKRYLRPDGSVVWASKHASLLRDADGRIQGAVVIALDIGERKEADRLVGEARDELARQVADLTLLHEQATRVGASRDAQQVYEELLGALLALEHRGKGTLSLVDREREDLRLVASAGFERTYSRLVARIPRGAGACGACYATARRVVVEDTETDPLFDDHREAARVGGYRSAHSTPLLARDGSVLGVLSTFAETPQRPGERAMRLADMMARQAAGTIENLGLVAALEDADRRKDEFLATLAHELRNPLAPIRNALHLMRLAPVSERVHAMLERQVEHMVRLVDDLMEASRISRGVVELERAPLALQTVLAGAVEASRPLIDEAHHELVVALPDEPIAIDGDAVRLGQVFANLLNNAAKYTDPGGRIEVSARREGAEAVVSVRDSGIGIAPEKLPLLFRMFAQVDRSARAQGGLGIGLALVRRLVQLHGGQVEATSEGLGCGAKFVVRLPISEGGEGKPAGGPTRGAPALPQRRVLVVDDNRDAADSLGLLLGLLGAEVRVEHDGASALGAMEAWQPSIALLDIGMPGMDGLELARRIRAEPRHAAMRLVALTGWGQAEDRERTRAAGFDHHLIKPVDLGLLEELLREPR
jgi:PAS domain S-box-containing protein